MCKKVILRLLIGGISITTAACSTVDPGQVAVRVNLTGGNAGFENAEVITSGYATAAPGQKVYFLNTAIQNYTWTADPSEGSTGNESMTFTTRDGIRVNTDMGLTWQLVDAKAFMQAYKIDDENYRSGELRNLARDVLNTEGSKLNLDQLVNYRGGVQSSNYSGIEQLQKAVLEAMNARLRDKGVAIQRVAFVNGLRLPENIQAMITQAQEVQARTQKAQAEVAEAEAQLRVRRVQAETARIQAAAVTPLLLEQQRLENERAAIEKWNGVLPTMMSGGAVPFSLPLDNPSR